MRPHLVIFDMDGTVLDTLEDLLNALNYALEKHGHGRRTLAQMTAYVGSGLYAMVTRALGNCDDKAVCDPVFADFKAYYLEHYNVLTRPYPGIPELIKALKAEGVKCAISSNKVDSAAGELSRAHFGDLVDMCVGESPFTPRKPDP
ncbi:MAG: HAD hydrolase-like protein, partial [Clostridia bacterium]|nr:HAD hydrolase-like protein [Clostridia bacterium]